MFNQLNLFFFCLISGQKTAESLRKTLTAAVNRKDKEAISSAITECVASGFLELETDVTKARDVMTKLTDRLGKIISQIINRFFKGIILGGLLFNV